MLKLNEELQISAQESSEAKRVKAKKTISRTVPTTQSRHAKPPDGNPTPMAMTAPAKTARATKKGKKAAATNNQVKREPTITDKHGGIQTNQVDVVAEDE